MSDFPEIEGYSAGAGTGGGSNNDFLARERELLGDEFGGAPAGYDPSDYESRAGAFPDLDLDGRGGGGGGGRGGIVVDDDDGFGPPVGHAQAPRPQRAESFDMDSLEPRAPPAPPAAAQQPVTVTGNDELEAFESQFPELEPTGPQTNGFGAPAQSLYAQPATAYQAPSLYQTSEMPEEESEHIKAWREKQAEEIRSRDERSKAKREETISAAERAIDDFYHAYNSEKEKAISRNKEQEAAFLQARDDALGKGTTWERIAEMVDLQDSRSKTATKSARDLGRFKEVLLSLKRDGETAPGAAGY